MRKPGQKHKGWKAAAMAKFLDEDRIGYAEQQRRGRKAFAERLVAEMRRAGPKREGKT